MKTITAVTGTGERGRPSIIVETEQIVQLRCLGCHFAWCVQYEHGDKKLTLKMYAYQMKTYVPS